MRIIIICRQKMVTDLTWSSKALSRFWGHFTKQPVKKKTTKLPQSPTEIRSYDAKKNYHFIKNENKSWTKKKKKKKKKKKVNQYRMRINVVRGANKLPCIRPRQVTAVTPPHPLVEQKLGAFTFNMFDFWESPNFVCSSGQGLDLAKD